MYISGTVTVVKLFRFIFQTPKPLHYISSYQKFFYSYIESTSQPLIMNEFLITTIIYPPIHIIRYYLIIIRVSRPPKPFFFFFRREFIFYKHQGKDALSKYSIYCRLFIHSFIHCCWFVTRISPLEICGDGNEGNY